MAATADGQLLTEEHRRAQVAVGVRTVARLMVVGGVLTADSLDDTAGWETAATAVVAADRTISAALAAAYATRFKRFEVGGSVAPVMAAAALVEARARAVLRINGPVRAKTLIARGAPREQAVRTARTAAAAAGMRQVVDGGRRVLTDTLEADPEAIGWFRVTDSAPCAFCALMASRGAVYESGETAQLDRLDAFGAHDGCACTVEPRYRRDAEWPGRGREWKQLYQQASRDNPDVSPGIAWRRAYEGRT